jgi:ATP-dependent helicase/DNAse subunit B
VIRKPGIRPKKIANRDRQAILATGEYFGIKVSELTMRSFSVGNDRENNELYFNRLRREVLDNPAKYFQRKPIYRMDHEVVEYASELWNIAKTIGEASREDTHYRNSEACMTWGSPCEYLGVCSGHDTIDSDKWESIETVHSELDGEFPDGGRTVLTCSRMKTFQTCRRKHQYRYILGKRRRDDEGREALFLGTIMHLALEAWWGQFTEEASNGDSSNGSPAIEVGQPRESEIS